MGVPPSERQHTESWTVRSGIGADQTPSRLHTIVDAASGATLASWDDIQTGTWHDVDCPAVPTIYQRFVSAIRGESAAEPDFARGAALQRLLDRAEDSAAEDGKLLAV
mgnify:CR=1 FL=1